jgi:peptidoglycan/xylan/chitin deacetylase (PgdA/CDA1 family)
MPKRTIKRALQRTIASFGRQNWNLGGQSLLVLTYHRILPDDFPEWNLVQPGMVVRPQTLQMHLQLLKSQFTMVDLEDWTRRVLTGRAIPRKACAITFDDGWSDNFRYAFPVLSAESVPATIFLVTDMVGTGDSFWPERLARLLAHQLGGGMSVIMKDAELCAWFGRLGIDLTASEAPVSRDTIDKYIVRAKSFPDEEIKERLSATERQIGTGHKAPQDMLTWAEVRTMVDSGLVRVGSHTCKHIRMIDGLDPETVNAEIVRSKQELQERLGCDVTLFCYPNGQVTEYAKSVVRRNYLAACTTRVGWNRKTSDLHMLRRISMHDDATSDEQAFLSRISGWI